MTRYRSRAEEIVALVGGRPAVQTVRLVASEYGAAGGGLLAAGLAYTGLLAVLSACLLVVGVIGFVVQDPDRQASLVDWIVQRVPPLAEVFRTGLERVASGAAPISIAGLAGVAWGAGRFYDYLDAAFARVFREDPRRGFRSRTGRGLVLSVGLIVAILGSVALASLGEALSRVLPAPGDPAAALAPLGALAAASVQVAVYAVAVAATYRWVPPVTVSWWTVRRPAIVVAIGLAVLSNIFVAIEARLLGALELFSGFIVVLATMIWLSFGFQLLLAGAAWVRVRRGSIRSGPGSSRSDGRTGPSPTAPGRS